MGGKTPIEEEVRGSSMNTHFHGRDKLRFVPQIVSFLSSFLTKGEGELKSREKLGFCPWMRSHPSLERGLMHPI